VSPWGISSCWIPKRLHTAAKTKCSHKESAGVRCRGTRREAPSADRFIALSFWGARKSGWYQSEAAAYRVVPLGAGDSHHHAIVHHP
jgi:hypothetical protein